MNAQAMGAQSIRATGSGKAQWRAAFAYISYTGIALARRHGLP